jgi:hypothetical protein
MINDPATSLETDDQVRLEVHLPRKLFNGLRQLAETYQTGVHGAVRHVLHNAVDNAKHNSKQKAA